MKIAMTNHATTDRLERLLYINNTIGFGKVVFEHINYERNSRECLTDTGVLIIKDLYREVMITAFICSFDKASALYHDAGYDGIPHWMVNRINKNKKHAKRCA